MRNSTPPPPKNTAAARSGGSGAGSNVSKPFASTGPSERGKVASSRGSRSPYPTPIVSPSPRGRSTSTAKYLANKGQPGAGLSAYALAQIKDPAMSMSQRVDQIMKIPKVDARPEMYRIDVALEEDLRTLHDQQSKRDPELAAVKLSKGVPGARDLGRPTYDFLDSGELVSSVGESSCSGSARVTQKRHVPPLNTSAIATPANQRRHGGATNNAAAPWERSPGRERQGKLASPRSNAPSQVEMLSVSPIDGRVVRSNSGRSTMYEFPPSLAQLRPGNGVPERKAPSNSNVVESSINETQQTASVEVARPPTPRSDPPRTPRGSAQQSPSRQQAKPVYEDPNNFPAARGASPTATHKPGLRTQATIAKFEKSQPQNQLPPRPIRHPSPRGVVLDFSHDSHFTSFSETNNTIGTTGMRSPHRITIGKVTSPSHAIVPLRAASPPAVGDPNVIAPVNPPPKRISRSVTPPGGRRGSSGIFDVVTKTTAKAAQSLLVPKKSMANMDRLVVNTRTSDENTLKSPSLEGRTDAQHAAANASPLRRTMSSLQTQNLSKVSDTLKAAVPQRESVSRRMVVSCPHADRLKSSTQVSVLLSWA